jgi:1,4-alpha-glucan branching enzyme
MTEVLPIDRTELDRLILGEHRHPHDILGGHRHDGGITVRAYKPLASSVAVRAAEVDTPLHHEHDGIWVGTLATADVPDYRLVVRYDAEDQFHDDPYRFLPSLGDMDLHLISEGRHERLWTVLGAHVRHDFGVPGTSFAVWAPRARGVRLRGDFNNWADRELRCVSSVRLASGSFSCRG